MALLNSTIIDVVDAAEAIIEAEFNIMPTLPVGQGSGAMIHPQLGSFDFEYKPDEWVNIDDDAVIAPTWAGDRTLGGSVNVLWGGFMEDTVIELRWKALGGLAMPISQLRMLRMMWENPIDPALGYINLYPSFANENGYQVIFANLQSGSEGITLDDVVNYKDVDGNNIGWVVYPVTATFKIVRKLP